MKMLVRTSTDFENGGSFKPGADLPTLKRLRPEHLFMLCEWNSGEGPSEARSPNGGSGVPPLEIKKTRLQTVQSKLFWSFICEEFFLKVFY